MIQIKEKQTTLNKAQELVNGDRQEQYGDPKRNMQAIADIWTVILRQAEALRPDVKLEPEDVALMMVGLKLARESYQHKDDNCVDMIGYISILEEL